MYQNLEYWFYIALMYSPTWHGPDFTCNFPQTVLRLTETDQSQIYPRVLLYCLCLQLELRPTQTLVRLKNLDFLFTRPQSQKCQMGCYHPRYHGWLLVTGGYCKSSTQRYGCTVPLLAGIKQQQVGWFLM